METPKVSQSSLFSSCFLLKNSFFISWMRVFFKTNHSTHKIVKNLSSHENIIASKNDKVNKNLAKTDNIPGLNLGKTPIKRGSLWALWRNWQRGKKLLDLNASIVIIFSKVIKLLCKVVKKQTMSQG